MKCNIKDISNGYLVTEKIIDPQEVDKDIFEVLDTQIPSMEEANEFLTSEAIKMGVTSPGTMYNIGPVRKRTDVRTKVTRNRSLVRVNKPFLKELQEITDTGYNDSSNDQVSTYNEALGKKLQNILQKLYPEIKLNIINNPRWHKGKDIFNQLIEDDYFEGNFKYYKESERISNLVLNKLRIKVRDFHGKIDERLPENLEDYKNFVFRNLLRHIGIPAQLTNIKTNVNDLENILNSKKLQDVLQEEYKNIKKENENYKKQLNNFYEKRRLLRNFLQNDEKLEIYHKDQQVIIEKEIKKLNAGIKYYKNTKIKSEKYKKQLLLNSKKWEKDNNVDYMTNLFLRTNASLKKVETLINYFKIDKTAADRIQIVIENELNRREKFYTSQKVQSKLTAIYAEKKVQQEKEKRIRDEIYNKELNKYKNSTVVEEVENLVGKQNIHSLERILESKNINEELAIIKNNNYPLNKTPDGKKSILYESILNLPEINGNIELANKMKSLLYSDNFIEWFGDWTFDSENSSKIVDKNGEPKLVYHGSGRDFNKFSEKERGSTTGKWKDRLSDSEMSFMFTDNPSVAFYYAIIERKEIIKEISYYFQSIGSPLGNSKNIKKLINDLYDKHPSVKSWVQKLKEKGLSSEEILKEFKRVYFEYNNIKDLTDGGSIGNANSSLNEKKKVIKYLEDNRTNLSEFKNDSTHIKFAIDRSMFVLENGNLVNFKNDKLVGKNIKTLSDGEYNLLIDMFKEEYVQLYNKINDEIKAGGFTPKIYPSFLNVKKANKKDFKNRPFVFQSGDTKELLEKRNTLGASYEVADLIEDAINSNLNGSIIENIADPISAVNYAVFKANQIKSVFNTGEYSKSNDDFYNQTVNGKIIGQANIKARSVLVDAMNQKQDTLPHEYAHHYIAWFRDTDIVQEGIKKWGSEEALVQSIGEQSVKQQGEAWNWWKGFVKWLMNKLNSIDKLKKEEITNILTDAFLTRQDLSEYNISQENLTLSEKTGNFVESKGYIKDTYFSSGDVQPMSEVLEKLIQSNEGLAPLAKHIQSFIKDTDTIELIKPEDRLARYGIEGITIDSNFYSRTDAENSMLYSNYGGFYKANTNETLVVDFGDNNKGYADSTILHEIIHRVTKRYIQAAQGTKQLQKFEELLKYAREHKDKISDLYPLKNLDEFITGVFTNSKFINSLRNLDSNTELSQTSFFDKISNFILSLFKTPTKLNNLYSQVADEAFQVLKRSDDYNSNYKFINNVNPKSTLGFKNYKGENRPIYLNHNKVENFKLDLGTVDITRAPVKEDFIIEPFVLEDNARVLHFKNNYDFNKYASKTGMFMNELEKLNYLKGLSYDAVSIDSEVYILNMNKLKNADPETHRYLATNKDLIDPEYKTGSFLYNGVIYNNKSEMIEQQEQDGTIIRNCK